MPNTIRWGILGTGTIARKFASGLALLPDARIQAVASRERTRAEAFAKEFGALRAHASYEGLARDADVDVVYVATPHAVHRDNCRLALENGKAVLCEKPFAVDPAHAREVIALARERGLFCMEAMWMRFVPILPELEGLLRAGAIGEPQLLIAQLGWPIRPEPGRRIFDPSVGGGALLDLGVYPVSLAFRLFGRPKHVDSQVVMGRTGVDEQAALLLEHEGGRQSMVTTSIRGVLPNDAVVHGSEGSIHLHAPLYCPERLTVVRGSSLTRIGWARKLRSMLSSVRATTLTRRTLGEGYAHEAIEVMRCLRAGERESPGMPLDESVAILETIDEARRKRGELTMRLALVGCGFVADYYVRALRLHPELEIVGVLDRDGARGERFAAHHGLRRFVTLEALLADPKVELVVNLTNPASHFAVSKSALEADKHVYSEKPLSLVFAEAQELVALAERRGRSLAGAPCNVLGATAQTMWKALREDAIGKPRLVYAELDEGPIHLMDFKSWRSESGNPWPYADEFEVGCTLEHAGYCVTWLVTFFGPATRVTSFASVLVPDKDAEKPAEKKGATPDFTVACIEFGSGVVARLTNSLLAPHDHSVRIVGDTGVLATADSWDTTAPVTLQRRTKLGIAAEKRPQVARWTGLGPKRLPLARDPNHGAIKKLQPRLDFAAGIAEVASAIAEGRPSRMSARFALHVNEIVLAIQDPAGMGSPRKIETTFEPMSPLPWGL